MRRRRTVPDLRGWIRGAALVQALAVCALSAGCLPRYRVTTTGDDFAGVTVHRMRGNVLDDPGRGGEWIELNAEVSRRRGSDPELRLLLHYRDAERWLWIPYGESLQILADEELITLSGTGSLRSRRTAVLGGVEELAAYPVSSEQLRRVARAGTVRVRVLGRREFVERRFSEAGLLRLREFISEQVDQGP